MRRWLALVMAATTSLVLIALLVPMALLIGTVAENGAVNRATDAAESVAAAVSTLTPEELALTVEQVTASGGYPLTVFLPDGRTLGRPVPRSDAVRLAALGRSVTARVPGGNEVLVSVQSPSLGAVVVRVFVSEADLNRGVREAWIGLLALGLALIVLGIVVADRLARTVTTSIAALAEVSHRLAGGELAARASAEGPREVRSVALALNHLAGRIDDLLAAERESVVDLSHRLRTPLTGLRLNAEALTDSGEAKQIGARVDDLERAVTSIINTARRRSPVRESCDATSVVVDRVRFWSVLAEDQDREMRLDLPSKPLPVAVASNELAACVDALFGNVFAHTPEGVSFGVRLGPGAEGGASLVVTDAGPGFGAEWLVRGNSGGDSTGLGLDIARRTAESSGGSLSVGAAPAGGAVVEVTFGPPASP
ncbi:sensor histidine kinase [Streptosporangium lutulentum]|uniref:Signal transduction histidine-protein kinase/phosphatase MprB n=1 Tax=Streptosporangium lutulentum TaxID=1461250 RepID=A0ABT9QAM1_9ACTN|nr:HAMP domain-containing sensor histidine kinase [Streptosporangium lutulentum]MDP9843796.1 signal transduction histidine kinase [Streptosporangium lutulentum]